MYWLFDSMNTGRLTLMFCVCVCAVTGHMFVYPLVADLLAQSTDERARAVHLINATMSYIVDNGYYLIDVTGAPTTYDSAVWLLLSVLALNTVLSCSFC